MSARAACTRSGASATGSTGLASRVDVADAAGIDAGTGPRSPSGSESQAIADVERAEDTDAAEDVADAADVSRHRDTPGCGLRLFHFAHASASANPSANVAIERGTL